MTDIHTVVAQLTRYHTHRQPYTHETNGTTWDGYHITSVPPLIQQLAEAQPSGNSAISSDSHGTAGSRPAARIDALDTLMHIDLAAARWVRDLGEDDPGNTIACVQKLYGLAASAQHCGKDRATREARKVICCTAHSIESDMRTWWTQARITSGWDSPAWAPNNTCPHCDERRSLRIRVDDQAAMCMGCRAIWDAGSIGILAEHVRVENGDELDLEGDAA